MLFMQLTLFHLLRSKSAMSTVLGMLIFIGVLFTCVMPFFLYINEVNSLYDQTIIEMKQFDRDRSLEDIAVYAYPLNQSSSQISLYIKNQCPLTVEIVRIWINDQYFSYNLQISGMGENITDPIDIQDMLSQVEGVESFQAKVTTARGNTFSSQTNPLQYSNESGWSGGQSFAINIIIELDPGVYNFIIEVNNSAGTTIYNEEVWVVLESSLMRKVDVSGPDTYHVEIIQTQGPDKIWSTDVEITLEEPTKWVYPPKPEEWPDL